MAREFEELVFDGHNYPIWVLDVKISLAFRGILPTLSPSYGPRSDISGYIQVPSTIHHPKSPSPRLKVGICDRALQKKHSFLVFFMFLEADIHISKYVPQFEN
jgi:hypothetical protein